MTTRVIVHNSHQTVEVIAEDRVLDQETLQYTDEWKEAIRVPVTPGQLFETYATNTRRIVVLEPMVTPTSSTKTEEQNDPNTSTNAKNDGTDGFVPPPGYY